MYRQYQTKIYSYTEGWSKKDKQQAIADVYEAEINGGAISRLSNDLEKSIEIGSAAAAIVVTKVGCAPAMPNLNEILEFMKYNKINEGE